MVSIKRKWFKSIFIVTMTGSGLNQRRETQEYLSSPDLTLMDLVGIGV
jgi:hypothetical protein